MPGILIRGYFANIKGFPSDSNGKESAYNSGDLGSIPGRGRSTGEGNGNQTQYSCLENSMGKEDWGCKESTVIERLTLSFSLAIIKKQM